MTAQIYEKKRLAPFRSLITTMILTFFEDTDNNKETDTQRAGLFYCPLVDRAVARATRGRDGRQEGCERGYYHLHRNLNETLLLHHLSLLIS